MSGDVRDQAATIELYQAREKMIRELHDSLVQSIHRAGLALREALEPDAAHPRRRVEGALAELDEALGYVAAVHLELTRGSPDELHAGDRAVPTGSGSSTLGRWFAELLDDITADGPFRRHRSAS